MSRLAIAAGGGGHGCDAVCTGGCGSVVSDVGCLGAFYPSDYNLFISLFEANDMGADFNDDGFLDPLDYNGFINAFEAGC